MGRALETLRTLSGMMTAPPGGGDRDQEAEKRSRIQFIRGLTASYMDLYNNAQTVAEKENYQNLLKGVVDNLPPEDRKAVDPFLKQTIFDPMVIKEKIFKQQNGERPVLPQDYEANPMIYFQTLRNQVEYDGRLAHYKGMQPKPLNKILSGPDDNYGVILDSGTIAIMNKEELKAAGVGATYNMSAAEVLASGGIYKASPVRQIIDGRSVDAVAQYDIFNKRNLRTIHTPTESQLSREAGAGSSIRALMDKRETFTDGQRNLIDDFAFGNVKNPLYEAFQNEVLEPKSKLENPAQVWAFKHLDKEFGPHRVVVMKDVQSGENWTDWIDFGLRDSYIEGPNFGLKIVAGDWIQVDGEKNLYIYDEAFNVLKDSDGFTLPEEKQQTLLSKRWGFKLRD